MNTEPAPQPPAPPLWSHVRPDCLVLLGTSISVLQAPVGPGNWLVLDGAEVVDAHPLRDDALAAAQRHAGRGPLPPAPARSIPLRGEVR